MRTIVLAVFVTSLALLARAAVGDERPAGERPVYAIDDSVVTPLTGVYASKLHPNDVLTISSYGRGQAYLAGHDWDALGWFGTTEFDGVWRRPGLGSDRRLPHAFGALHVAIVRPGVLQARFDDDTGKTRNGDTWTLVNHFGAERPRPADPVRVAPPTGEPHDPAFGEYVYAEELPEAITRVPPNYPENARRASAEGTVIVQALVGRDGHVKDTRVVNSIPLLDEAAVQAVRQWVFKPAMAKHQPVAVWVAIPVKFSLH